MNEYSIEFEIFGKVMKCSVYANSIQEAEAIVEQGVIKKIKFNKVLKKPDIMDFLNGFKK